MFELIPIGEGILLGWLFATFRPRASKRLILLVVCSAGATIVSGEFRLNWGFYVLDILEVSVVSTAVAFLAKYLRGRVGFRSHSLSLPARSETKVARE
jgi:hypothetical protein